MTSSRQWAIDYVTCACGKRGYTSRKDARRASRARSIRGVNAYRCKHPNAHPTHFWHLGHLPEVTKAGRKERSLLGAHASRQPTKFRGGVEPPGTTPT